MEDLFYECLKELYADYLQYGEVKYFSIHNSAYNTDELYIWEYDNIIVISDIYDYLDKVNTKVESREEIPYLLYVTNDSNKILEILKSLNEENYYRRLESLMRASRVEKSMTLEYN